MPTVPVKAAGWRIEPPVSVAVAPAQSQAATAAAGARRFLGRIRRAPAARWSRGRARD